MALVRDPVDPGRSPLSPAARRELLAADVPTHERPGERYGLAVRVRVAAGGAPIYGHSGATGDSRPTWSSRQIEGSRRRR
ncbi:hypothetical protein OV090_27030 [Nannocystis sp. RBIL2]|uniref:hypothetical protein n=1 Tax=Nannocystis sp. RBIL2 TaxID=2996788 RepID=UPI00226FDFFF|nr:hypothetical protein [Nannocystis sp. RBIL2]MCY1068426.1 hypothetical protein [Nannocystis sp. RBIL2]